MTELLARGFRVLLRLFPRDFRERYGAEMEAFFRDELRATPPAARPWRVVRSFVGTGVEGMSERLGTNGSRREGGGRMGEWTREARIALRSLARRPGFAAVALATIGLGIGAATAVFSVVDAVVLRPFPYPSTDRLVAMWTTFDNTGDTPFGLSLAVQYDYAQDSRALESIGGYITSEVTLTGLGPARRAEVVYSWGDLYGVTGITPVLGRLPAREESETGAPLVALVSHRFWRTHLEGDPDVVGRTLEVDQRQREIIGVLPPDADLPDADAELWFPMARSRSDITDRSGHSLDVLARLAPGVTLADARQELQEIQERWQVEYAGQHSPGHPGHDLHLGDAHEWYYGDLRPTGFLLLGAAGLLLVLACANVAALLLARGETRVGEFALRRALGAARGRVMAGLLLESGILALAGGVLGVLLALLGTRALLAGAPPGLPRIETVGFDARVAVFAVAATLVAGLVFGSLPAWRGSGASPGGARGQAGPDRALGRSLGGLVVAQLALAVVLVSGAALLTRSVGEMLQAESGVETTGRLTASVSIPISGYGELEEVQTFWTRLLDGVQALPGVETVAFSRLLPLGTDLRREVVRLTEDTPDNEALSMASRVISHGYLEAAGIPVLQGRGLEPGDVEGAPKVAILNRAAAEAYFPGQDPVGRQVQPLWVVPEHGPVTVVGIVENVRHEGVRAEPHPELYVPYTQVAWNEANWIRSGYLVVKAGVEPLSLVPGIRGVVEGLDPAVPLTEVDSWEGVLRRSVASERFVGMVVLVFALCALVMASLGTFGVISWVTARRTREIGVRVALGAQRGRVLGEILSRAGRLAVLGAGAGVVAFVVGAPLLRSFLYGVAPRDPGILILVPLALVAVALAAAAVPAARASGVAPVEALREE